VSSSGQLRPTSTRERMVREAPRKAHARQARSTPMRDRGEVLQALADFPPRGTPPCGRRRAGALARPIRRDRSHGAPGRDRHRRAVRAARLRRLAPTARGRGRRRLGGGGGGATSVARATHADQAGPGTRASVLRLSRNGKSALRATPGESSGFVASGRTDEGLRCVPGSGIDFASTTTFMSDPGITGRAHGATDVGR
jgi:hypothetical protein